MKRMPLWIDLWFMIGVYLAYKKFTLFSSIFNGSVCVSDDDGKRRPLALVAIDVNRSVVGFHDGFDNGQANSIAAGITGARLVSAVQVIKDMGQVVF